MNGEHENLRAWDPEHEQQMIADLREREAAQVRRAIAQEMGIQDMEIEEPTSAEEEVWNALLSAYRKLKAAKPEDRSEKARRYAVTITEYEKMLSYFNTMVFEEFVG